MKDEDRRSRNQQTSEGERVAMIDQEQQRDYGEERYWRDACPGCAGPCSGVHFSDEPEPDQS